MLPTINTFLKLKFDLFNLVPYKVKTSRGKAVLSARYKKLRNRVTNSVRRDTIKHNGERIEKLKCEDEI